MLMGSLSDSGHLRTDQWFPTGEAHPLVENEGTARPQEKEENCALKVGPKFHIIGRCGQIMASFFGFSLGCKMNQTLSESKQIAMTRSIYRPKQYNAPNKQDRVR